MLHMLSKANDGNTELKRYLDSVKAQEAPPKEDISKDEVKKLIVDKDNPKLKIDVPDWKDKKNDDFNEYEYSDKKDADDKEW